MILQCSQRGGSRDLANHLMSPDNDHVELHSLRGFCSDDLHGALQEAYALSRGTRCKRFLFSLSLNPPPNEQVSTEAFERAIERVEREFGLIKQSRAIIFHEKDGADGQTRRHAHAVWSRIDTDQMKAVPLPFTHKRLREISRQFYIEHGWSLPRGFTNSQEKSMKTFTLADWQQAKRIGKDPRAIKDSFADAWAISDSRASFTQALSERGYRLARGDRRGFVGVDERGEVFSIPRMAGVKTNAVRERLGSEDKLPSVDEVKDRIARDMLPKLGELQGELTERRRQELAETKERKALLVERQRAERKALAEKLQARQQQEALARQAQFRNGLKGLWDRLRGAHSKTKARHTEEAAQAAKRDKLEKDRLVFNQMDQRNAFSARHKEKREAFIEQRKALRSDVQSYSQMKAPPNPTRDAKAAFMDRRKEVQAKRSASRPRPGPKLDR